MGTLWVLALFSRWFEVQNVRDCKIYVTDTILPGRITYIPRGLFDDESCKCDRAIIECVSMQSHLIWGTCKCTGATFPDTTEHGDQDLDRQSY